MNRPCPACGRTWDGRAGWCGTCGASLGPVDPVPTEQPVEQAAGPRSVPIRFVAVALGIGATLVALVVLGRGTGSTDAPAGIRAEVAGDVTAPGDDDVPARLLNADDPVPADLLATCDGPGDDADCVRWVQHSGEVPRPGAAALVTIVDDRVVGLDVASGAPLWATRARPPVRAPLVLGDHTVLVDDDSGVTALDVTTGDQRWHLPGQRLPATPPGAFDPAVLVLDDLDGALTGVDVRDGTVRWTSPGDPSSRVPVATIPLSADRLLLASPGLARVVDVETGATLWSADGSVLAASNRHVVTMAGTPDGHVLAVHSPDGTTTTEVPLADDGPLDEVSLTGDSLVLRTAQALVALDLDDLAERWRWDDPPTALVTARPLLTSAFGRVDETTGLAAIATRSTALLAWRPDGTAAVIDEQTGQEVHVWGEPLEGCVCGFLTHRRLWRVHASSVEAFDVRTGDRLLQIEVGAPPTVVMTSPLVVEVDDHLVRVDLPRQ